MAEPSTGKPKEAQFNFKLPPDLVDRFAFICKEKGLIQKKQVELMVRRWIKEAENPPGEKEKPSTGTERGTQSKQGTPEGDLQAGKKRRA